MFRYISLYSKLYYRKERDRAALWWKRNSTIYKVHPKDHELCWNPNVENFIRFCFWRWLQNQTLTTFFFKFSFSAIWMIFSLDGRGCIVKNASKDRFSESVIEVRFLFLSSISENASDPFKRSFASVSASSSHVCKTGFRAIILLWLRVRDSNRQIVDWLSDPTPANFRFPRALPTSAWVTRNFILRCLNHSAKASNSLVSYSTSPWFITWMDCCIPE